MLQQHTQEAEKQNSPEGKIHQNYQKSYCALLNRTRYYEYFSCSLLVVFFHLQYAIPILLVIFGSIATIPTINKEQNNENTESNQLITSDRLIDYKRTEPTATVIQADNTEKEIYEIIEDLVLFLPYIFGLLLIIIREINITANPAQSHDISARYNNQFSSFRFRLITDWTSLTLNNTTNTEKYTDFLNQKNQELSILIDQYIEARSLRKVLSNNDSNKPNIANDSKR